MKFKYKITTPPHVQLGDISKVLPENFSVGIDDKESFLTITYSSSVSKEKSYADLQKEIDRISFLTQIHIDFSLKEIENADGSKTTISEVLYGFLSISANVAESLSTCITTQQWGDNDLSVQLRLWTLAQKEVTLAAKVNLLFQIIEIEHPNNDSYPKYMNIEDPNAEPIEFPDQMTESRLLRHLVSHGKGEPQHSQLKRYCRFRKFNSTHDPHIQIFFPRFRSDCIFWKNKLKK